MEFINLITKFLLLLERRQLPHLEAELWKFAQALDAWLYELFARPRRDWRARLDQFLAEEKQAGRIATPEGRQSLVDYLRWWAITIGLEQPGDAPNEAEQIEPAAAEPIERHAASPFVAQQSAVADPAGEPTTAELLLSMVEEERRLDSLAPEFAPQLPQRVEHRRRVKKVEVIKGFWDDYRALLASGEYEPSFLESVSHAWASSLLPSSEPGLRITFDDGTILLLIGGGPEAGALAEQALILTGVGRAALSAPTLWRAVVSATKHLGQETAEQIADAVVQQVTGLPVGPAGFLPSKRKSAKPRGDARQPRESRTITDLKRRSAKDLNAEEVREGRFPPYYARVDVREFVTQKELRFVRVYSDPSFEAGKWLVRADAIAGMTPAEIKKVLGLRDVPLYIVNVTVPVGTRMRLSIVGPQPQWGAPVRGVHQFESLQRLPASAFTNGRRL